MSAVKKPTFEEFLGHDGLHYYQLWKEVGNQWCCPSCKRTKYEIMRWAKRFPNKPNSFWGWVAPLHRHHDHSASFIGSNARFPVTTICDQCNSSDGVAKRRLNLPSNFSFSPEEIAFFVTSTPHGKHKVDFSIALMIYDELAFKNSQQTLSSQSHPLFWST